jgi:sensor c-di-GMP phosphodiesterase-like protein
MIRKPLARTVVSMVCGALCGIGLALMVGDWTVRRQQQKDVAEAADAYIARADQVSTEAIDALSEIDQTGNATCTDAEVSRLRRIVLTSRHLKSTSRLRNGEAFCSSTVGSIDPPMTLPLPDVTSPSGLNINLHVPQIGVPGADAMMMQRGNAAVSLDGEAYAEAIDPRLDYVVVTSREAPLRVVRAVGAVPSRATHRVDADVAVREILRSLLA